MTSAAKVVLVLALVGLAACGGRTIDDIGAFRSVGGAGSGGAGGTGRAGTGSTSGGSSTTGGTSGTKTCGAIVTCVLSTCSSNDLTCQQRCAEGANTDAAVKVASVLNCVLLNGCRDVGCAATKCSRELSACMAN